MHAWKRVVPQIQTLLYSGLKSHGKSRAYIARFLAESAARTMCAFVCKLSTQHVHSVVHQTCSSAANRSNGVHGFGR